VMDIIANSPDHTAAESAIVAADLVGTLSGDGPFTVFAPTDAAFAAIDSATLAGVLADIPTLTAILTYHVHSGNVPYSDLTDQMMLPTLNGQEVIISLTDSGANVNNAHITVADLVADNGVVHVIDAVLLPPTPDSIDEVVSNWSVMPNPANEVIVLNGVAPEAHIAMIDLTGRTVREFAQGTTMLSVGDMPRGTYLLTVTEGRNIQTKKVMVQ
ncbi:MAG: fasciclin domain-containing protein, partial [Bacteroidota bacterium]|nr:fasciclin domain-containing protein [Bacteroidota bacterium]